MEVDQESSIFWNSRISGLSAEVTAGGTEADAGTEAGFWAAANEIESRKAEKPATKRVMRKVNSP
jgi:hypothetical protein